MKHIERLLFKSCGYTIIILFFLYLFATISDFPDSSIAFRTFALVLGFGVVIACSELIFTISIKHIWKVLIHYAILLVSFLVIFIVSGNLDTTKTSSVFSSMIVFTVLYFLIFAIVCCVKKALHTSEHKKHFHVRKEASKMQNNYKPLYKD